MLTSVGLAERGMLGTRRERYNNQELHGWISRLMTKKIKTSRVRADQPWRSRIVESGFLISWASPPASLAISVY